MIPIERSDFLPGSWNLGLWDSQAVKDTELPWMEGSALPRDDPSDLHVSVGQSQTRSA